MSRFLKAAMARSLAEHEARILNTRGDELPDQRQLAGTGAR